MPAHLRRLRQQGTPLCLDNQHPRYNRTQPWSVDTPTLYAVMARWLRSQEVVTTGEDQIFSMDMDRSGIVPGGQIANTPGGLAHFLDCQGARKTSH